MSSLPRAPNSPLGQDLKSLGQSPNQRAPQPAQGPQLVPFATFFRLVKGDKVKAEQIVPGITSPEGAKLLRPGPDGKPHVPVQPDRLRELDAISPQQAAANHAAIVQKMEEILNHKQTQALAARVGGGASAKEWLTASELAQQLHYKDPSQIPPTVLEAVYPGGDHEAGMAGFMRTTTTGEPVFLNPQSKAYKKQKLDVLKRLSDQEERANLTAEVAP
jgi:hypothetical protein